MNAVWWQIIIAVASGLMLGVLTQGIGAFIRSLRRPRLDLHLDISDNKTYFTREISGTGHRGRWVAIWASNKPRWGKQTAKYCYPMLIRIERMTAEGELEEETGFVRDRIPWGGVGGGAEGGRGYIDRDVHKGDPSRISLGFVSEAMPHVWHVNAQPTGVPAGRKNAFEPGVYRLTVRLYSDNAEWTETQFLVDHTGVWDQLSISEV